jgi:outer membrane protein assembly factor BamB
VAVVPLIRLYPHAQRWLVVVGLVLGASGLLAQSTADWPQFRGPTGQGHSSEHDVPLTWSETVGVQWKSRVPGLGWSSAVVAADRVWLTSAVRGESGASLRVMGFDVRSGAQVVDREVFRLRSARLLNPKNSLASPTPVFDDGRIYVHFGAEGTAALTASGEVVWTARLPYEAEHGSGGSPIVYRDLLIFSCDGFDQAFVVALDKHTGRVRWKTARRRPWSQAYSTPLVIRVGVRDQVLSVGAYRAVAYDPDSGEEIWHVTYGQGFSNVPRPVSGNGMAFVTTGFDEPSLLAVRTNGQGDVTRSHLAWATDRGVPLTSSPLLVGSEIYFISDGGVVSCLDAATGKTRWQQRLGGNYSASPVFAAGRIYFFSEDGVTTSIAPGPVFRRLATSRLDGAIFASPAVAHGSMFIRTDTHLYRLGGA